MPAQPDNALDLDALHDGIRGSIAAAFPDLATVEDYREDRRSLPLPAVLIELVDMEPDPDLDAGTEQLGVVLRFELQIVIGFRAPNAKREIRKLAAALAQHVNGQRWGQRVGPARVTDITREDFAPELDKYEVWRIEFEQTGAIGNSVWTNDGTTPREVLTSWSPEVGPAHVAAYRAVSTPMSFANWFGISGHWTEPGEWLDAILIGSGE